MKTTRFMAAGGALTALTALATLIAPGANAAPLPRAHGFAVDCAFSHTGPDDPIVMPGMSGMSHQHEFFGNTSTNSTSTGSSLLAAGTTCQDPNDKSAYWVPALYWNGTRVEPRSAHVRYAVTGPEVTPFPAGFMAVTGRTDSTATWSCVVPGGQPSTSGSVASVPTCSGAEHLVASIIFGDCWDGSSLDSANHASHLVASTNGACPSDHSVRVPQVTLSINYPAFVTGGSGVTLASGSAATLHGDMFEAWANDGLTARLTSPPPGGGQGGPGQPRMQPGPQPGQQPGGPQAGQQPPPPPPGAQPGPQGPGQGRPQGPGAPPPRR